MGKKRMATVTKVLMSTWAPKFCTKKSAKKEGKEWGKKKGKRRECLTTVLKKQKNSGRLAT